MILWVQKRKAALFRLVHHETIMKDQMLKPIADFSVLFYRISPCSDAQVSISVLFCVCCRSWLCEWSAVGMSLDTVLAFCCRTALILSIP